jgi:hypothetical protein
MGRRNKSQNVSLNYGTSPHISGDGRLSKKHHRLKKKKGVKDEKVCRGIYWENPSS